MVIQSKVLLILVAATSLMACSQSKVSNLAPSSQKDTGIIIIGSEAETSKITNLSTQVRVLSAKHNAFEVKGLSLEEIQKVAPGLTAEQNKYYENVISPEKNQASLNASKYKNFLMDGEDPAQPTEEEELPPALQGCNLEITEELPTAEISLANDVLATSPTIEVGQNPAFSSITSKAHPNHPGDLEIRWDILAPGFSAIPSEVRSGEELTVTPDALGFYRAILVTKDSRDACAVQVAGFFVTANPNIQFAADDEERPTIDLVHFTHLPHISAQESWEKATGEGVIIAVLDTGLNYNHPGIKFNLAVNNNEKNGTPGNDDDGNQFKDDVLGWDFVNNDNKPFDDQGHGSHVSGLSSSHIFGSAKGSKVMPVKVLNAAGGGDVASIIAGVFYAADNGAKVINASLGHHSEEFRTLKESIEYANSKGVLFVAAAGNDTWDLSQPGVDTWPAELNVTNILTVAALGADTALTEYSNFGEAQVDVAAPGGDAVEAMVSLAHANPEGAQFVGMGGTSMASPVVAGIAAQVLEVNPNLTPIELKSILMKSGSDVEALDGKVGSGKMINALDAVMFASPLM